MTLGNEKGRPADRTDPQHRFSSGIDPTAPLTIAESDEVRRLEAEAARRAVEKGRQSGRPFDGTGCDVLIGDVVTGPGLEDNFYGVKGFTATHVVLTYRGFNGFPVEIHREPHRSLHITMLAGTPTSDHWWMNYTGRAKLLKLRAELGA